MAKKSTKAKLVKSIKKSTKPKESCFVIMPFGGVFDIYYETIYKIAIENSGLTAKRADDLFRPSNIMQDIWNYTNSAKLLIADLSNKNPNVFYELGLAHALSKPAILVTQSMDDVPFDLRGLRIIEYDKNLPNWGTVLTSNIEIAIQETIASPEESIPTAFLDISRTNKTNLTIQEKEVHAIKEDLEQLKREVRSKSVESNYLNYVDTSLLTIPTNVSEFNKPLIPSHKLAIIVGNKPLPRTEAVKRIWEYIKKNDLQDNQNRRMINADKTLKQIFGNADQFSMFELAKHISRHLK